MLFTIHDMLLQRCVDIDKVFQQRNSISRNQGFCETFSVKLQFCMKKTIRMIMMSVDFFSSPSLAYPFSKLIKLIQMEIRHFEGGDVTLKSY